MHVLFVIDTWGLIGGTERHAAVVVPALLEKGHSVTVLCRQDMQPGFADVPVLEFPALEGETMPRWARNQLAAAVREASPDVVFVSALRNVDAAEELVELAPVVRYVHDHTLFCPGLNKSCADGTNCREPMGQVCMRRFWQEGGCVCFQRAGFPDPVLRPLRVISQKWRELDVARRSSRVLTNSHYMRAELVKVGFAPETTSVLYYFTQSNTDAQPTGPLGEATEEFLARSDAPLLFTPARLTLPDKGVDHLVEVLARVQRPFRSVIAGSGPAHRHLEWLASEAGLAERVHFTGWLASPGIETLYERADVVVCPSVWDEPFGLVGIEAMVHGSPVVAFDVGGIPEWLDDGETGHLIPRKDVAAMAAAIDSLLAEPERSAAFGRRGRAVVAERFPKSRHLEGLEEALVAAAG